MVLLIGVVGLRRELHATQQPQRLTIFFKKMVQKEVTAQMPPESCGFDEFPFVFSDVSVLRSHFAASVSSDLWCLFSRDLQRFTKLMNHRKIKPAELNSSYLLTVCVGIHSESSCLRFTVVISICSGMTVTPVSHCDVTPSLQASASPQGIEHKH